MKKIVLLFMLSTTPVTVLYPHEDVTEYYDDQADDFAYDEFDVIADDLRDHGIEPTVPSKVSGIEVVVRQVGLDLLIKMMALQEYVGDTWQTIKAYFTSAAPHEKN